MAVGKSVSYQKVWKSTFKCQNYIESNKISFVRLNVKGHIVRHEYLILATKFQMSTYEKNCNMAMKFEKIITPWFLLNLEIGLESQRTIRTTSVLFPASLNFFFINYSIPIRNFRVHKQLCFSINWAKSPEFLLQFNLLLDFAPEMVFKIKKLLLISSIAYTLLFVQSTMSIPSKSEDQLVNMNKFGYFLYTFKANTIR